jgi:hypothetical protein
LLTLAAAAAQAQPPPSLTLVVPRPACATSTPNLALCLGPIASELDGLRKLACLLDALERWRLEAIRCAQARANDWQERVIWPLAGRRPIGAALARVRTLREEAETLAGSSWQLDEPQARLASIYTSPDRVDRRVYEATWGASVGAGRDVQDLVAWHAALTRNVIQGRTSAAYGLAGELPENTWERIGRELPNQLDAETDALAAMRYTPQLLADRLRVETSTTRLHAQALVTAQLQRDWRRLKREREQALGGLLLDTLTRRRER